MHLILASTSPRRRELLALLGIPFDVMPPDCEEDFSHDVLPSHHVQRLALEKARSVALRFPDSLVLGGDTLIEIDQQTLGKPDDLEEAGRMLRHLSGRCHAVHTGMALVWAGGGNTECLVETATIWMRNFSDADLASYLETRESLGKAGAYSIQGKGAALISRIEGDYPTIVGLPLLRVAALLEPYYPGVTEKAQDMYRTKPYENWREFERTREGSVRGNL